MASSLPRRHALKLMAATMAGMGAAMLGLRPSKAQAQTGCVCKLKRGTKGLSCVRDIDNAPCGPPCPEGKKAGAPCG